MKPFKPVIMVLALALFGLPGHAQVVTYVGYSTGATMPGSASDYIFFNTGDYPSTPSGTNRNTNNTSNTNNNPYSVLTSFSFIGGVNSEDGSSSYSSINTPAPGGSLLPTGDIQANGSGFTPALAFEPGTAGSYTTDGSFNPGFNYNDFDVYLMYSNTGGTLQDTAITLSASSLSTTLPVGTPATVSLDGLLADPPADTNVSKATAYYVEFNITGLKTALQSDDSIVFTASATHEDGTSGGIAYIGAASFESVPEPKTWAMLFSGIGLLLGLQRLRRKLSL